jgi:hypothetical protein
MIANDCQCMPYECQFKNDLLPIKEALATPYLDISAKFRGSGDQDTNFSKGMCCALLNRCASLSLCVCMPCMCAFALFPASFAHLLPAVPAACGLFMFSGVKIPTCTTPVNLDGMRGRKRCVMKNGMVA